MDFGKKIFVVSLIFLAFCIDSSRGRPITAKTPELVVLTAPNDDGLTPREELHTANTDPGDYDHYMMTPANGGRDGPMMAKPKKSRFLSKIKDFFSEKSEQPTEEPGLPMFVPQFDNGQPEKDPEPDRPETPVSMSSQTDVIKQAVESMVDRLSGTIKSNNGLITTVFGGLAMVIVVLFLIVICCLRRQSVRDEEMGESSSSEASHTDDDDEEEGGEEEGGEEEGGEEEEEASQSSQDSQYS